MIVLRLLGGAAAALIVLWLLIVSLWAIFPPPQTCIGGQTMDSSGTVTELPTVCQP